MVKIEEIKKIEEANDTIKANDLLKEGYVMYKILQKKNQEMQYPIYILVKT